MSDVIPDPKTVKEVLGPGMWIDQDDIFHIDPSPLIRKFGLTDSEEMQAKVIEDAKEIFRKEFTTAMIIDQFDK